MTTEQQDAFMILQVKACGLEEIFLSTSREMDLTEKDEQYAIDACREILHAIDIIRGRDPLNPPELEGTFPVVLYLGSEEDREELIQAVMEISPNMKSRKL